MKTIFVPPIHSVRRDPIALTVLSATPKAFRKPAKKADFPSINTTTQQKDSPIGELVAGAMLAFVVITALVGFWS